ncbi:hypothetical protein QYF61_011800 [Mycteria americana]|uniref:Uncharacterized protein n=1 Tax=Mycteria americana TaxID=33587 RepID=A0AAN7MS06_MYCAM|nr:hypothetical protein QYF61_011800 [Mycteria americana]
MAFCRVDTVAKPLLAGDGASTTCLGNPCQCLTTLIVKNFFLKSSLNLPSLSLKPLLLVLSQQALLKILEGCYKVSLEPSLLQADQLQLSQPVLLGKRCDSMGLNELTVAAEGRDEPLGRPSLPGHSKQDSVGPIAMQSQPRDLALQLLALVGLALASHRSRVTSNVSGPLLRRKAGKGPRRTPKSRKFEIAYLEERAEP